MKNITYLIKRILSMNTKGIFDVVDKVHAKTGKGKALITIDIIWCGIRHLAGYVDYLIFEMYNLNESQRKLVMTRGRNNAYVRALNDSSYYYIFNSKKDFNQTFNEFVKRDWFTLCDGCIVEFEKFLSDKKVIFAKPNNGVCGKGIEKLKISDFEDARTLWYYLESRNLMLVEEAIIQHPQMNLMHPHSINTVRAVTILYNNEVHVVATYLRIGNGRIVDNFNSGGMVVPIDVASGVIKHIAIDKAGHHYEKHPVTNTTIPGFQIPMWDECIALVKEAALRVPQIGLVG